MLSIARSNSSFTVCVHIPMFYENFLKKQTIHFVRTYSIIYDESIKNFRVSNVDKRNVYSI